MLNCVLRRWCMASSHIFNTFLTLYERRLISSSISSSLSLSLSLSPFFFLFSSLFFFVHTVASSKCHAIIIIALYLKRYNYALQYSECSKKRKKGEKKKKGKQLYYYYNRMIEESKSDRLGTPPPPH